MRKPFRIALVLATAAVVIVLYAAASLLRSLDTPEFKAFCDKQSMYVELVEHRELQAGMPAEDARWRRVAELIKRS